MRQRSRLSSILGFLTVFSLLFQAAVYAEDIDTTSSPANTGQLLVYLVDDQGNPLVGQVDVTDFNGGVHSDWTNSGGWALFYDMPAGSVFVVNAIPADGYFSGQSTDAMPPVVVDDSRTEVTLTAQPVPALRMMSLDEPIGNDDAGDPGEITGENGDDPASTGDEGDTGSAEGEGDDTSSNGGEGDGSGDDQPGDDAAGDKTGGDDAGSDGGVQDPAGDDESVATPDDGEGQSSDVEVTGKTNTLLGDIAPAALPGDIPGYPNLICDPRDYNQGADVTIYVPYKEGIATPTFQYTEIDRFDTVTGPSSLQDLTWVSGKDQWEFSIYLPRAKTADFVVMSDGTESILKATCAQFTPIPLQIQTIATDSQGNVIPDGGRINPGTSFGDTAKFVVDPSVQHFMYGLEGQQVTYNLYKNDGTCGGTPVWSQPVTLGVDGAIPDSSTVEWFTPGEEGTYDWQVVFAGDPGNFLEAKSECGSETVVVGMAAVEVRTEMQTSAGVVIPQSGTVPVGTVVRDTTTLVGATADAAGTVIYSLYAGDTCDGTPIHGPEPVTVTGGVVPASSDVPNLAQGTYHWVVTYSGDLNNAADESSCFEETFTVGKWQPEISTEMMNADEGEVIEQGDAVGRGTSVYDTATMENVFPDTHPTGTVTYYLYLGSCSDGGSGDYFEKSEAMPLDAEGNLPNSPAFPATATGTYNWVVHYSGDENNAEAWSRCGSETFNVVKSQTTITTEPVVRLADETTAIIPLNGVVREPATVHDTATVSGLTVDATGSVTFTLYKGDTCEGDPVEGATFDVPIGDVVEGVAFVTTPDVANLDVGQYNWVATYSGDLNNGDSESPCGEEQFFVTHTGIGGYVHTTIKNASGDGTINDNSHVPLGTSVYDTAQFYGDIANEDGTAKFSGTLTYSLYRGEACDGTPVYEPETVTVTANQPVPEMGGRYLLDNTGTYNFQATFTHGAGDDEVSISSPCGTETLIVDKAIVSLTTVIYEKGDPDKVIAPQSRLLRPTSVADGVNVTYSNQHLLTDVDGPNGTITYQLFNNSGCTGTAVFTDSQEVLNGVFPQSDFHALSATDSGVYNWKVTFTPDANETNYTGTSTGGTAVSACGSETFYLEAQPDLTTEMYWRAAGDESESGDVLTNGNDTDTKVGDFVRDTATLSNFAGNAKGTVTFTLYTGLQCDGIEVFSKTVDIVDGEAASPWYKLQLFGDYSWEAVYSGDLGENGFNRSATHCKDETFTANKAADDPVMETVMRSGETVIPHLSYVSLPITVTDQAVFTDLSNQATGTVTYTLYASADCHPSSEVGTDTQTVADGQAPRSKGFTLNRVTGGNNTVYSWTVTFEGTGEFEGVTATSECGEEQFRLFNSGLYSASTVCSYNPTDNRMSFTVFLNPRDVNDKNGDPVTLELQPYKNDLSLDDLITIENPATWVLDYPGTEWRRVDGRASWDGGSSWATFSISCNTSQFQPVITTAMYVDGVTGELTNGSKVAPGSQIYDTVSVANSTVIMTGTLTYKLYRGPVGDTANSTLIRTTTRDFEDQAVGDLPVSETVTVSDPGTYYWVVDFTPSPNDAYPANKAAVSNPTAETFHVTPIPAAPGVNQALCRGGEVSVAPELLLATTSGITYQVVGQPTNDGSVKVIAELTDGSYVWPDEANLPGDWAFNTDDNPQLTVTFDDIECLPTLPVAPTFANSVCQGGAPAKPTLTATNTIEIHYSWDTSQVANGGTVTVTATVQDDYGWNPAATWPVDGWEKVDSATATFTHTFAKVTCPVAPQITGNACTGGVFTPPSLNPATTDGVTYSWSPNPVLTGQGVVVTATLANGYAWPETMPTGWTDNQDGTAEYTLEIPDESCTPILPVDPGFTKAVCGPSGTPTGPTITATDTEAIHYTWNPGAVVNGGTVVVTATLQPGYAWNTANWSNAPGWGQHGFAAATFTVHLPKVACPVAPDITDSVCTAGAPTRPSVTPKTTANIEYSVQENDVDGGVEFTVTATLKNDAVWPEDLGDWDLGNDPNTATYTFQRELAECDPVLPVAPDVTGNVCEGGIYTEPGIDYASGPEGVTYELTQPVNANGTYVVTATLSAGQAWDDLTGSGWEPVAGNAAKATYTETLVLDLCDPVVPEAPRVDGNACTDGAYTESDVVMATGPEGVDYTLTQDVDANGTYIVTAELSKGQAWGDLTGTGWEPVDGDASKVTFTKTIELKPCISVPPVAPESHAGSCVAGVFTRPTVTIDDDRAYITYDVDIDLETGDYTVTATLEDGYSWGAPLGDWEVSLTHPAEATFQGNVDVNNCIPVIPVMPDVTQAVCEGGLPVNPAVSPATTPGITYTYDASKVKNGATVVVTATVDAGRGWDPSLTWPVDGWGWYGTTIAKYIVTLDDARCPVAPTIGGNVCTGGAFTPPSLVLDQNPDIEYSFDEDDVITGGDVVITATLKSGFAWPQELPEGWTPSGDDAVYTLQILDESCVPEVPVAPQTADGVCEGGTWTAPTVERDEDDDRTFIEYGIDLDETTGAYTVTATLLEDGYSWGDHLANWPTGWVVNQDNLTEATYEGTVELNSCTPVVPAMPEVSQAVCTDGLPGDPSVSTTDIENTVSYTFDEDDVVNGGTVVITAELEDGFIWDTGEVENTWPTGWNVDSTNPAKATYTLTLDKVTCPVAPDHTDSVCRAGELTDPTVTTPDSEGITYSFNEGDVVNGGTVVITATLVEGYAWPKDLPQGWTLNDDGTASYTVELDEVNCIPARPVPPSVTNAVCTGGELTNPSIATPETEGIDYSFDQDDVVNGGTVVITATVKDDYGWPNRLPSGWTRIDNATASYTVHLRDVRCLPAIPVAPRVTQAVCTGGEVVDPQVVVRSWTLGVNYSYDSATVVNGGTVVITATVWDGFGWPDRMPQGWTKVDGNPAQATYTVELDEVNCIPVRPQRPSVTNAVCTGGELTTPSVTPATTAGIDYTIEGEVVNGGTVKITATVRDGYGWPNRLPAGWTKVDNATATYTVRLLDVRCLPAIPVAPHVEQVVCTGGELTDPKVTILPWTFGVSYTKDGDVVNGGTVTITATVWNGFGWPDTLPAGWEKIDSATAQYVVNLDDVSCIDAVPVAPDVNDAVCIGGELVPPTISPVDTDGIEYTYDAGQVAPGAKVVVTATLDEGFGWPDVLPEGWTKVSSTMATTTIELDDVECETVIPAAPVVNQAVCTGGEVKAPAVDLQETNGITYAIEGEVVNGGSVTVIATVEDGFSWAATLPAGWTKVSNETATYTIDLDEVNCDPVLPAAPTVTQSVCTNGLLTNPTVTPATTVGVTYHVDENDVVNGGTVVITATVQDGYAWAETLPAGWDKIDSETATYTVDLADVSCDPVVPEAPVVQQPVCTPSGIEDPLVTTPATSGVDYTIDGEMVPGGTVIITATVQDGFGWPTELPAGWTKVNDSTATYTVQLDDADCIAVDPGLPVVTQPVCTEDGTVRQPGITLPETPGIEYTIEGEIVPGGKVIVTATLIGGYTWGMVPQGWTLNDDGTATFIVTLDAEPDCGNPATPVAPTSPVTTLPTTGNGGSPMTSAGMAIVVLASLAAAMASVAAWLRREGAR